MGLLRWLYIVRPRLRSLMRSLFRREAIEREIEEELEYHLERQTTLNVERGLAPRDAEQAARRQFGNVLLHRERARDADVPFQIDVWWRDLRYAARQLARTPLFSLLAVFALAVGIGANITIFSFINAWLLRPLDAKEPSRLLRTTGPGASGLSAGAIDSEAHILPADYLAYRDRNQTFSALAASHAGGPRRVRWEGTAQMIPVTPVTGNYFDTLGVSAAIGRTLTTDDAQRGAREVVVLSDLGWRRFFGADSRAIGSTVVIDGVPHIVVGVLPEWFTGTYAPMLPQIYQPFHEVGGRLNFPWRVQLIGRLRPGVSPEQAHADLTRIAVQLTASDRQWRSIEIYPAQNIVPFMSRGVLVLAVMFGLIVLVVLLITCDDIAMLAAIRAAARGREIAVRLALGASRGRVVVQLLLETILLCGVAGAVGTYVAFTAARFATQFYVPVPMPFALTFKPDWRVILFAIAASFGALLFCGLLPLLKTLRTDLVTGLRSGRLGRSVQSGLIVTQVTLSTALLVTAAVLTHSLFKAASDDRGFVTHNVVMSTIVLSGGDFESPQRRAMVLETLLQRVEQAPGVAATSVVANVPGANNAPVKPAVFRSGERLQQVDINLVSRGLFKTLSIPVLAGRDFNARDDSAPAAVGIVNETLARAFWPAESPIGQYLQDAGGSLIQVIGLVRDSEHMVNDPPKPYLYRPLAMDPTATPTFLMKAASDATSILPLVKNRLTELDPDLVAYNVMMLDDRLALGNIVNRAAATVAGSFGLLALALGSIGIYGTISLLVLQRRREIGVRLALGASPRDVTRLVMTQGMKWTGSGFALGLGLGALASLGLSRVARGVAAADVLAFLIASFVVIGVGWCACHFPARRASRLDPAVALRDD